MSAWPSGGLWLEPVWRTALDFHKGREQLLEVGKRSDCACFQPELEGSISALADGLGGSGLAWNRQPS